MCSVDPIFFSQGLQVLPLFAQRKGFWASLVSGTLGGVSCLLSAISFPVTRAASYAWTSIESVQGRAGSRRLLHIVSYRLHRMGWALLLTSNWQGCREALSVGAQAGRASGVQQDICSWNSHSTWVTSRGGF